MSGSDIFFILGLACWPVGFSTAVAMIIAAAVRNDDIRALDDRLKVVVGGIYILGFALLGVGGIIEKLS